MIELTLQLNGKSIGLIKSPVVPRVGEFVSVPARDLPPGQHGFVAFEVKEISYQVTPENVVNAIMVDIEQL